MPKVSVIIPVYNVEKYLGECLDSILGQTLKDIEVLCIDDGSTDGSAKILAEYAAKDKRVKLLSQPNGGAFLAREKGIAAAMGEFLYFMDADDMLDIRAFAELYELASRENLDQVVFGSSVFCEKDVSPKLRKWAKTLVGYYSVPRSLDGRVMSGIELMGSLLGARHFHVSPPLRLIRATAIKGREYGLPDARSRADNYFTPVFLYYSKRACAVNRRYYRRRVRDDSLTTATNAPQRHFRNLAHVIAALAEFPPFAKDIPDEDSAISRHLAKLAFDMAKWMMEIPPGERFPLMEEVFSGLAPKVKDIVLFSAFLGVRGLCRRPRRTIKSLTKALALHMTGVDKKDWWI